jgi:hypothetical protein
MGRRVERKEEWSLIGLQDLIGSTVDDGYVHSSIYGFDRHVKAYRSNFINVAKTYPKSLDSYIEDLQTQVKPTEEMRDANLPQLFSKQPGNLTTLWDDVKKNLMTIVSSTLIDDLMQSKIQTVTKTKRGKEGEYTEYVLYINGKKTKYASKKGATNALLKEIDMLGKDSLISADNLERIKTLIQNDLDSNLAAVQRIAGNQARIANKRKGIDTVAIMRQLQEVLKAIRKQIGITNTAHPKAFSTLRGITSLNQWLKNRTATITNSGLVNEDSNAIQTIANLVQAKIVGTVTVDGTAGENKISTADMKMDLDTIGNDIGVTLKQSENFLKASSLDETTLLEKVASEEQESFNNLLQHYRYFILNYSFLYDVYGGNFFAPEVDEVNTIFGETIGKVFFIQALLGNIIKHSEQAKTFVESRIGIPYLLVTMDHAVYTYDVLEKLKELPQSGAVNINVLLTPQNRALYAKLREKKAGATSYSEILGREDLRKIMSSMYRRAFQRTVNNTKVPAFKMVSSINMAKLIEITALAVKR